MLDLGNCDIKDTLPSSIAEDKEVKAICDAMQPIQTNTHENIGLLLLLPRLDQLGNELLDELAWQYHVDYYDSAYPRETKVKLIRKAIYWHRIKGTPFAVSEVVSAIYKTANVEENWDYGGEPYHFRISGITESITESITEKLVANINEAKNVRSWLDGIGFYRKIGQKLYFGGIPTLYKKVSIGITKYSGMNASNTIYIGSAAHLHKKVLINKEE